MDPEYPQYWTQEQKDKFLKMWEQTKIKLDESEYIPIPIIWGTGGELTKQEYNQVKNPFEMEQEEVKPFKWIEFEEWKAETSGEWLDDPRSFPIKEHKTIKYIAGIDPYEVKNPLKEQQDLMIAKARRKGYSVTKGMSAEEFTKLYAKSAQYNIMSKEMRDLKIDKCVQDWLASPSPDVNTLNIDLVYDKNLIKEMLNLKQQKNGNTEKEADPQ
jgi:hypothetical protein